jgi:fibrillarin-like pre-rRNA processing protein
MIIRELFNGVYSIDNKLATKNLVKRKRVYGEQLVIIDKIEYRLWNPYRSKLAAAIFNGLKNFNIEKGGTVLYIGAATGTTSSHVSDIISENGIEYCVELSERNMRDLIKVCEDRKNMLPILADAHHIESYAEIVEKCDAIYQDASAREQAAILKVNSRFLKKGGLAYFVIKSQSIDISKKPKDVFKNELSILEDEFELIEKINLEPYDRLHMFAVLRKR